MGVLVDPLLEIRRPAKVEERMADGIVKVRQSPETVFSLCAKLENHAPLCLRNAPIALLSQVYAMIGGGAFTRLSLPVAHLGIYLCSELVGVSPDAAVSANSLDSVQEFSGRWRFPIVVGKYESVNVRAVPGVFCCSLERLANRACFLEVFGKTPFRYGHQYRYCH